MSILKKILEEIKQYTKDVYECDLDDIVEYQRRNREDKCTYIVQGIEEATEFIRSHMDDEDNDGWISVEERLPEEKGDITKDFNLFKESLYLITDGTSVTIAPFDGGYFRCCDDYAPYTDVIAWKPLPEPYKQNKDIPATEHIMSRFMKVE